MEAAVTNWLETPRPSLLKRIAARIIGKDFSNYLASTVTQTDNIRYGKHRDFNPQVAVNNFFSLVYAAAQMNANAVARTPLRLYGRTRKGKTANFPTHRVPAKRKSYLFGRNEHRPSAGVMTKIVSFGEDFQEITDHPALDVLRGVNRWFNAYDMTLLRVLYLELTGNAYTCVRMGSIRGRGFPVELWPMPSQWVKVVPSRDEDSPIIAGYVYGRTDAEAQDYAPEEVIRWNYPNPRNLYYGLGKVEAAWREICLRNSKSEHDQAVFDNGARPDYAVLLKNAPAGEVTRFQKDIEARLKGTKNRGKFLTINAEQASVMPLTFTPEQLGDQDRVIEAICNVFGVPVSKFLTNKNVAGGQAGVSDVSYLRDTVLPICRMDEETLNADYLPRFAGAGSDLVLAYDNPIPEDREAQRADDQMRLTTGVITRDEWRVENGYDEQGGQSAMLLVPNNLVPIDDAGKPAAPALDPMGNVTPPEEEADDEPKEEPETVKMLRTVMEIHQQSQAKVAEAVEVMGAVVKALKSPTPVIVKADGPHKFASTQVNLPPDIATAMLKLGRSIPDDELAEEGRETEPHVTLKYGLHSDDPTDVRDALVSEPPITLTLGNLSLFPATDNHPFDVLKLDVESEDMHRLNAKLRASVEHTEKNPDYHPHATIAYLKPGMGQKYMGKCDVTGKVAVCDGVVFSPRDGAKTTIPLIATKTITKAPGDLLTMHTDPGPLAPWSSLTQKQKDDRKRLLLALLAFWDDQRHDILSNVDPDNHQPVTGKPAWDKRLSSILLAGMVPIGFQVAHDSASSLGVDLAPSDVNAAVQERLQAVADKFAPLINQTTVDRVNDAISGIKQGADNADELLRTAIGSVFDDAADVRGPIIADDGAFIAEQAGTLAPGEAANNAEEPTPETPEEAEPPESPEAPQASEKPTEPPAPKPVITAEWVCVEDDRLCPICAPLDGRIVVAGDEFAPGINLPTVDTHPKCRCVVKLGTRPANYPPTTNPQANRTDGDGD
jgi:HK97 family phage portal protein